METDPNPDATFLWYSAEEGQEMSADAQEELGEERDKDCLRDLIVNLCPSTLRSLQDVSQTEKILRCIHRDVEEVCTEPGQVLLRSVLGLLSECCPEETVQTLLRISPSCDNAALAMWEMLLSLPSTSETVLDRLLGVIQGWRPICAIPSASQVLYRLSQRPRGQRILEALFPRLLMSLTYKLSLAAVILGREQPGADQPVPFGLAVEAIKVLLHAAGCQGHVQNIQEEGGWDMMLQADTLERGISLLARELRKSPAEQQRLLFQHIKEILTHRREWQTNFAMTFYTELLGCQGLGKDWSDLRLLHSYLSHGTQTVRLRALQGLVALAGDPQMAREMRGSSLVENILACLKDPSRDIRMEALLFFCTMMGQLKRKEASPVALMLVEKFPALFGDESSQVQELSLSLFEDTMKAVVSRDKAEMKEATRRVVLSLFLHMNAESRSVAEASGKGLLICAKFLGWRKLKRVLKKQKTWLIGETLVRTTPS
ncbi:maestro heat-like repeat-containing protein family member 7 [Calypte anna]|uniref:maestro heat-like repeat-containing protein family member 7 n=1 Tax=Calypte anna TaxID=9244 RepID=UPI0011C44305|nr:maestro heat-like repeat-containing protein family member 7 [Calypte anna]